MIEESMIQDLVNNYVYQKEKLIEAAGGSGRFNRDRCSSLCRPHMEKMARTIDGWDTSPDIVMSAAFAWAKKNRHPDGPMPNMLSSAKYLSKALGHYLQVPYEVVIEKRCMALFMEKMDFSFEQFRSELARAGVTDMTTANSYPVETRCLIAIQKFDWDSVFYMAPELLETMASDKRVLLWMKHRGVTYEAIAKFFNNRRKDK